MRIKFGREHERMKLKIILPYPYPFVFVWHTINTETYGLTMTFILCNLVSLLSPSSLMETPVPALPQNTQFQLFSSLTFLNKFHALRYLVDLAKDIR